MLCASVLLVQNLCGLKFLRKGMVIYLAYEQAVSRVEKKYDISTVTASRLNNRLSIALPADSHNREGGYMVRSLYFDTVYSDDLADKQSGLLCRRKIRLRCYNPDDEIVKLERKYKNGQYQYKQSLNIKKSEAISMIKGDYSVLLTMDNAFAKELYAIMTTQLYRPKVIVEYQRLAFTLEENDTRITIDSDIKSTMASFNIFDPNLQMIPSLTSPILEVKYNNFLLDYVKDIVNITDRIESSISKYELACNSY